MDDDDQRWKRHTRRVWFSTNAVTQADCQLLASALKKKYGLIVTLAKADVTQAGIQQYRLCVSAKSYQNLRALIYPELIPSMVSKIQY